MSIGGITKWSKVKHSRCFLLVSSRVQIPLPPYHIVKIEIQASEITLGDNAMFEGKKTIEIEMRGEEALSIKSTTLPKDAKLLVVVMNKEGEYVWRGKGINIRDLSWIGQGIIHFSQKVADENFVEEEVINNPKEQEIEENLDEEVINEDEEDETLIENDNIEEEDDDFETDEGIENDIRL